MVDTILMRFEFAALMTSDNRSNDFLSGKIFVSFLTAFSFWIQIFQNIYYTTPHFYDCHLFSTWKKEFTWKLDTHNIIARQTVSLWKCRGRNPPPPPFLGLKCAKRCVEAPLDFTACPGGITYGTLERRHARNLVIFAALLYLKCLSSSFVFVCNSILVCYALW